MFDVARIMNFETVSFWGNRNEFRRVGLELGLLTFFYPGVICMCTGVDLLRFDPLLRI
jgi:hypothetical protein